MDDRDRQELAKKLDAELELFMEELAKKKNGSALGAAKPFNFDEWCREIHQHPAFMTELTEADDGECSDAVRALKAMKLEDEEERAETVRKMKAIREKLARRREGEEKLQAQRRTVDGAKKRQLVEAFKKRGIHFRPAIPRPLDVGEDDDDLFQWEDLQINLPQLPTTPCVYLDTESNELVWPLLLQYPEAAQTDFIADCSESTPIGELLAPVLAEPPEWDCNEHRFRQGRVRVFMALDIFDKEVLSDVKLDTNLHEVLSRRNVTVGKGLPTLHVYTKAYAGENIERESECEGRWRFKSKKP